jgi:RNA polymerase sigma-70 factor (ECF subfamily)
VKTNAAMVRTGPSSDEALALDVRDRRDRAALEELVGRYDRRIYGLLLRFLGSPDRAEEAAQETFLRMLRGLAGYRSELPFRPWLYRIALNAARSLGAREADRGNRERRAALGRPEEDRTMNPADHALRHEISVFVEELPENQREAVILHYYQGLSHSEVAAALEVPAGTVATRIHHALDALRGRLATTGAAVAAVAIEELLRAGEAEAAPSSIRAAVLRELTHGALESASAGALKGVVVTKTKLSSMIAVGIFSMAGGAVVGYAVRSAREPERAAAVAISRPATRPESAREAEVPPAPPRPAALPRLPASAAPASPPEQKKSKLQRAAAVIARAIRASGNRPAGSLQLPAADAAELMALMSDPETAEVLQKASELDWTITREFMGAMLEELIPDLTEDQKTRLQTLLADMQAHSGAAGDPNATKMDRKLDELKLGRKMMAGLSSFLTPAQQSALAPLDRMGVRSVPVQKVWATSPEGQASAVLDYWSKTIAPLSEDDRTRLGGAAADFAARLRAIQADFEATYGAEFVRKLANPSPVQMTASSQAEAAPNASPATYSGLMVNQFDAYGRLLELERDERQMLAALLPGQAAAIRDAEPSAPLLDSGPAPGFLGVSVADQPGGGARVTQVIEGAPARIAGLREGDVILEFNGTPLTDYASLTSRIREAGAGAEIRLKVRRGGQEFDQAVRLGVPK